MTPAIPIEELQRDVDAYTKAGGNISEAARSRGMKRGTFRDRLRMAEEKLGIRLGKIVDGRIEYVKATKRALPKKGHVARYLLSSCQNNTHVHKTGFANLLAYMRWLNKRPRSTCELILGSFSYAIDAYGAKAVKRGTYRGRENLWYAPELLPFICDESVELAPGLVWCGEMNILPTAASPLNGLADYNGRRSNIVPHVKHAMESIASLADEATKFNYTTGTITLRNYIQKRAGIVAERRHVYGALIVEVDHAGNWFVRQLQIGGRGEIYDIGPAGFRAVKISNETVETISDQAPPDQTFLDSIVWGDIHAAEMDLDVRDLGWSAGGCLDQLAPARQFLHDVFSMRSRSHHEILNFHRTFEKFAQNESLVEDEIRVTADFLNEAERPWLETIVVRSNHDRHLDRWLNEANPTRDPLNAKYFTTLQLQMLNALESGDRDFNILEWALRHAGASPAVRFLGEDESYVICKGGSVTVEGIECGLHGDLGPNGARGSTRALARLGRPVIKDHDHRAGIIDSAWSGGVCASRLPYMRGPNAQSASHVLAWCNGARQILTFWNGRFRV